MTELNPTPDSCEQHAFESLLDLREAAAILGMHRKTLEAMARNGEVPAVKLGKRWKFRLSSLDLWVENRLHSTTQPGTPC